MPVTDRRRRRARRRLARPRRRAATDDPVPPFQQRSVEMRIHSLSRTLAAALAILALAAPAALARPGGPASAAAREAREAKPPVYWSYDHEAPIPPREARDAKPTVYWSYDHEAPIPQPVHARAGSTDDGTPWAAIAAACVLAAGAAAVTARARLQARHA
jgi:hypothetical protein